MTPASPPDLESRRASAPDFDSGGVMAKAKDENFSVASRLLPRAERAHLLAVYGFARFVDDVGDLSSGERLTELDWVEEELDRAFSGRAKHPLFVRLALTIAACSLSREPFVALIEANRQDQRVTRYEDFASLMVYCALSANPVGHLVLEIFDRRDARTSALSDQICSGLQLVEHFQDVGEDYRAGRIYLPREDLARFGVEERDLGESNAPPSLRRLMAFEAQRAGALLDGGSPLVGALSGAARFAIAGFVGGGIAQLDAIERARFDVLSTQVSASKSAVVRTSTSVLVRGLRKAS